LIPDPADRHAPCRETQIDLHRGLAPGTISAHDVLDILSRPKDFKTLDPA
jgi:hypothetical protein